MTPNHHDTHQPSTRQMMVRQQQALVLENQELASRLVHSAMRRYALPQDLREELCAAANFGLVQAAASFDPERGVKFATFASHRVFGEVLDFLRRRNADQEIPQESLDNAEAAPSANPEQRAIASQEVKRVQQAMMSLSLRERELIGTLYVAGPSLSEIACQHGISKGWASRLRERAIETIRHDPGLNHDLEEDEEQEREY